MGHLILLLLVLCLPPVMYDYANHSSLREIRILDGSGALAYTAYALYWINKLHNDRARFILSALVLQLTLGFFVVWTSHRMTPLWVSGLPLLLTLSIWALALGAALLKRRRLMGSALWSAALLSPLAVMLSLMSLLSGIPVPVSLF